MSNLFFNLNSIKLHIKTTKSNIAMLLYTSSFVVDNEEVMTISDDPHESDKNTHPIFYRKRNVVLLS